MGLCVLIYHLNLYFTIGSLDNGNVFGKFTSREATATSLPTQKPSLQENKRSFEREQEIWPWLQSALNVLLGVFLE